uniref:Putative CCR4-associated factor 1-like 11 n=1 Tax=Lygus hesperus TaxID=30085 RepID=A0A0A9YS00_LYGHE
MHHRNSTGVHILEVQGTCYTVKPVDTAARIPETSQLYDEYNMLCIPHEDVVTNMNTNLIVSTKLVEPYIPDPLNILRHHGKQTTNHRRGESKSERVPVIATNVHLGSRVMCIDSKSYVPFG